MIHIVKQLYGFGKISTNLIYAQSLHETGNFTSAVFKENKNLFGMRQAKRRKNFATGTNRNHATFKTHFDSIRDYFERQKNFRVNNTSDALFVETTLSTNYAEDTNYKQKWLATNSSLVSPVSTKTLIILFFSILSLIVLLRYLWRRVWYGSNEVKIKTGNSKTKRIKFTPSKK